MIVFIVYYLLILHSSWQYPFSSKLVLLLLSIPKCLCLCVCVSMCVRMLILWFSLFHWGFGGFSEMRIFFTETWHITTHYTSKMMSLTLFFCMNCQEVSVGTYSLHLSITEPNLMHRITAMPCPEVSVLELSLFFTSFLSHSL